MASEHVEKLHPQGCRRAWLVKREDFADLGGVEGKLTGQDDDAVPSERVRPVRHGQRGDEEAHAAGLAVRFGSGAGVGVGVRVGVSAGASVGASVRGEADEFDLLPELVILRDDDVVEEHRETLGVAAVRKIGEDPLQLRSRGAPADRFSRCLELALHLSQERGPTASWHADDERHGMPVQREARKPAAVGDLPRLSHALVAAERAAGHRSSLLLILSARRCRLPPPESCALPKVALRRRASLSRYGFGDKRVVYVHPSIWSVHRIPLIRGSFLAPFLLFPTESHGNDHEFTGHFGPRRRLTGASARACPRRTSPPWPQPGQSDAEH
ncbi:hypothetical protein ACFPRL_03205 [Pseudoclavibacter helvolus]